MAFVIANAAAGLVTVVIAAVVMVAVAAAAIVVACIGLAVVVAAICSDSGICSNVISSCSGGSEGKIAL